MMTMFCNNTSKRYHHIIALLPLLLILGGCCVTVPFHPQQQVDLQQFEDDAPPDPILPTGALLVAELSSIPDDYLQWRQGVIPHMGKEPTFYRYAVPIQGETRTTLTQLVGITAVETLCPLYTPDGQAIRTTAAALLEDTRAQEANLLLVYTVSTNANAHDMTLMIAPIITLGNSETVRVSGTAELNAALINPHTGEVYATFQTSSESQGWSSAWEWKCEAMKTKVARIAVEEALDTMIAELVGRWPELN